MVVSLTLKAKNRCHRKKDVFDLEGFFGFFFFGNVSRNRSLSLINNPSLQMDLTSSFISISRDQNQPHIGNLNPATKENNWSVSQYKWN